jgi:tyrosine-protein phosphatase YwqE
MTATPIINAIVNGHLDGEFDKIKDAIKLRKRTKEQAVGLHLTPGQEVTLNERIRPKRLVGKKAKVVKVNQTTVTITLVETDSRYRGQVKCPLSFITP